MNIEIKNHEKERVIAAYANLVEKSLPGKGESARQIALKHWDSDADRDASNAAQVLAVMRNLALRNAQFAAEIKALKN